MRLLALPECALTGYPPRHIPVASAVELALVEECRGRLRALAREYNIYLLVGGITRTGTGLGVYQMDGVQVGVRICFEVRFPEYFRELYRAGTSLDVVCFCDLSHRDDPERYELIKTHLRTRAVENVCPVLSVNATKPWQTAPTALFQADGGVAAELPPGEEGLLLCELPAPATDFGGEGRRLVSDRLTGG